MATTKILLSTGDQLVVEGTFDETLKALENAARSSAGTFARLTQSDNGQPLAVITGHVVTALPGDD